MSTVAGQVSAKQRKKLAPAFVVTVGLALQIAACGGNVDDGSGAGSNGSGSASGTAGSAGSSSVGKGGSGGANAPACPAANPYGKDCVGDLVCTYPGTSGCPATTISCVDGRWSGLVGSCNPPAPVSACPTGEIVEGSTCYSPGFTPLICGRSTGTCDVTFTCDGATSSWKKTADSCAVCPESVPAQGASCLADALQCKYPQGLGGFCTNARCLASGWELSGCPQPPPPPTSCPQIQSETMCAAESGCRWLWPGCNGDPKEQLLDKGCFAATDCATDAECADGRTCQTVVADPCHGEACAACGKSVRVCQFPFGLD